MGNAKEAKESSVHGQADQDSKTGGASDVSQNADATLAQENEPQEAGSKNSTNREAGIHGSGVATQETPLQGEGEGSENQRVEVTSSIGGDAGLDDTDGSPSGNGLEEDEDMGSGDGEGAEAGDGRESHDGTESQEGPSQGGNNDHRDQSSVSTEGNDSKEQEGSPNGRDGDDSSEENGVEEGDSTQATQDNQKLSPKDNRVAEGGIISQTEACHFGKSQDQVSLDSNLHSSLHTLMAVPNNSRQTQDKVLGKRRSAVRVSKHRSARAGKHRSAVLVNIWALF